MVTCMMIMINLNNYIQHFQKISTYIKGYDGQTKLMYFLIKDDDLLEKYNTIWNNFSADVIQLPLNIIKPGGLPAVQNLQNLIR